MNSISASLLVTIITYIGSTVSAVAQPHNAYAVGEMFTTALNLAETRTAQEATAPMNISKIYFDHGQVFIIVQNNQHPVTIIYDPIAHLIVADDTPGHLLAMKE